MAAVLEAAWEERKAYQVQRRIQMYVGNYLEIIRLPANHDKATPGSCSTEVAVRRAGWRRQGVVAAADPCKYGACAVGAQWHTSCKRTMSTYVEDPN